MKIVAGKIIACLGIVMLFGQLVEAQWVKSILPYNNGFGIVALAANSSTIFASTDYGLFYSTNNDTCWTLVSGFDNLGAGCLAINGSTIIASSGWDGFFLSHDNGISWIKGDSGLPNEGQSQPYPRALTLAVIDSNLIIAGTENGIYRSINAGMNWSSINWAENDQGEVSSLVVKGNIIFAGTLSQGVYVSIDSGVTWDTIDSEIYNIDFNSFAVYGSAVFAATSSGIYMSPDNGKSWTASNNGLPEGPNVWALAVIGTSVFAGLDSSVYRSLDSGKTWSLVNSRGGGNAFAVSGNRIFVGGIGGFRYSSDGGITWTPSNTGLNNNFVNSFAVYGSTMISSSADGESDFNVPRTTGVFRSTDNGNSWTMVNVNGGTAFAVNGSALLSAGGGLYSSKDSGASWIAVDTSELGMTFSVLLADGTQLFAGGYGGGYGNSNTITLFRSADSGTSWNGDTSGLPNSQICECAGDPCCYYNYPSIQALGREGNTLFAGLESGAVYRSLDTGATWTIDSSGHINSVQCFATNGSVLFAGTANGGVFISKDTGNTWTAFNLGLTNTNIQALFSTGTDLFAGTGGGGIFHSSDSGKTWTPFNNGLTDSSIQSFGVNDTYLFAGVGPGTYGGSVWRYPLSQVSVKRAQQIRSEQTGLKVHSMGRFNPAVSIDFSIPSPEKVSIGIYDLSGHLVTTLEDKLFVAGQHTLQWNARNAGSGCYVVRMQAGGGVQVRAVPVVRQ